MNLFVVSRFRIQPPFSFTFGKVCRVRDARTFVSNVGTEGLLQGFDQGEGGERLIEDPCARDLPGLWPCWSPSKNVF